MAKIKTVEYVIDGERVSVNFSCNTHGIFSTNLKGGILERLGIPVSKSVAKSLEELQKTIDVAVVTYNESKATYKLLLAIRFTASSIYTRDKNGEFNPAFNADGRRYLTEGYISSVPHMGFDYHVVIKEEKNGREFYYQTTKQKRPYSNNIEVNGYYADGSLRAMVMDYKFIDFTETALKNLATIQEQLRKASNFLISLLTAENMELLLSCENTNLLL